MADETVMKEVTSHGDDGSVEITGTEQREEIFVDFDDNDARTSGLIQKIDAIEQEKRELIHLNDVMRERIDKLKEEINGLESDKAELKREVEQSESDKRALESISARAYELETEVSRLQHDLITSMNELEEANKEVFELKREVEELKKIASKADVLEKERSLLLEKINKDAEGVKEAKSATEGRVRELEKKLEALEGREGVEKSERIKVEVKIDEKENEIRKLKKLVEDRDSTLAKNGSEMERMKKEREELVIVKNELEGLLKKSERKGKEMEQKMAELHKELEASEQMISVLKDKKSDGINGSKAVVMDGDFIDDGEKGLLGLKVQWPVVAAASTGASIAAVAVLYYIRSVRQR